MKLHNLRNRQGEGYTTWGCVWKRGECPADAAYRCTGADGKEIPLQSRITAYWPDGSVKWSAHTADAALLSEEIEVLPVVEQSAVEQFAVEQSAIERSAGNPSAAIRVERTEDAMWIHAGRMAVQVPLKGGLLFTQVTWDGQTRLRNGRPVLRLEEPSVQEGCRVRTDRPYQALLQEVVLEEEGPLQVIVRYTGSHQSAGGQNRIPFIIRMKISLNDRQLQFVHTFLYDGDEDKDFLKGLGLTVEAPLADEFYDRHVKFLGDHGALHECVAQMVAWRPRLSWAIHEAQQRGEPLVLKEEEAAAVSQAMAAMPMWSEYELCQDSPSHFAIRKKLKEDNCCFIDALHGNRARGGAAIGSRAGSVMVALRDFWETYPSGITFRGMDGESAEITVWLWPPRAEAMDFRHYANRGYNQVCYEGYDYKGATPYGIASTSEYTFSLGEELIPEDDALAAFTESVRNPVLYVGTPEYYHSRRAFGYWSLPAHDLPLEAWLEEQLDKAFAFYRREVEQRGWYGLFNYGDFMHTYDPARHQWRYDIGGYAWDNTELVPTLRTGREEVFTLAEKLSRHTSEVDVYHMGKYKGMGSRHNVRHWGCPCKEARIAMAGHHRFYYYLTGDRRMEDIFGELKDNEGTFLNKDPLGDFYDKSEMVYPSHARSGPDWSSLCANWMTQWERTLDGRYRDKITTGIEDIKATPLRLISGPDFEFDPATVHLRYIGEKKAGGVHLQICMGAPQIWMELGDLLEDEEWKDMLAEYGRFYFLSGKQQREETNDLIGKRRYSYPMFAAAMGAYGASRHNSGEEARRVWKQLLGALLSQENADGFASVMAKNAGNREQLVEIPWISTNFTSQWCLNVIMVLDFIRAWMPKDLEKARELLQGLGEDVLHMG